VQAIAATQPADPATLAIVPPELVDDGSDDVVDLEPALPSTADPDREEIASIATETWIYAEPRWGSRRIGYLRAGAIVGRSRAPAGNSSCPDGWYRVEPKGYLCAGTLATLNIYHPVVETSARRPALDTLPYTYVLSRNPPPPLYARIPNEKEQLAAEPDLAGFLRRHAVRTTTDPAYVVPPSAESTPAALLYGRSLPGLGKEWRSQDAVVLGYAKMRSGFALLSTFDEEGRRFGLTTDLAVIPMDRTRAVQPSRFSGLELSDGVTLPVAFVRSRHAVRSEQRPGGAVLPGRPLGWREALPIAGTSRTLGGVTYLPATDGSYVRADQVVKVNAIRRMPAWASEGRKWIDISILQQSLVAYEGTKPVFVTLVSTGADGLGDPKKTHSTVQGAFLIHTKHITVTMDGDEDTDRFDFRDVPFVQYFTEGYALHGAYWHDDFGTPRSHGCVNLSPADAAWLFGWTDPKVPANWHASLVLRKGTLVHIHP
jgi:hypothetical protein